MSKLITVSLINSVSWFNNCPLDWREGAYKSLKNMLSRIWSEPSPEVKRGIDFENHVYKLLKNKVDIDKVTCSDKFREVLRFCEGGTFQNKNKSFMKVDGVEYCLYGKEDVTFPDKIVDIKTTKKYNENKYRNSYQHKIYLYNTKKTKFTYIIAIFEGARGTAIQDIKYVDIDIAPDMLNTYGIQIHSKIKKLMEFFDEHPELQELYETKFNKY